MEIQIIDELKMKDWANSGEIIHPSIKCTIFYTQNKLLFLLLIIISVVVASILLFMYNLQMQSWHGECYLGLFIGVIYSE